MIIYLSFTLNEYNQILQGELSMNRIVVALFVSTLSIMTSFPAFAKNFVYITPVDAYTSTSASTNPRSIKLAVDRVVVIKVDDGELAKKFIHMLERDGGTLIVNSVLYKDTLKPVIHREIMITEKALVLRDETNQEEVFLPKLNEDLARFIYLSIKQLQRNIEASLTNQ